MSYSTSAFGEGLGLWFNKFPYINLLFLLVVTPAKDADFYGNVRWDDKPLDLAGVVKQGDILTWWIRLRGTEKDAVDSGLHLVCKIFSYYLGGNIFSGLIPRASRVS